MSYTRATFHAYALCQLVGERIDLRKHGPSDSPACIDVRLVVDADGDPAWFSGDVSYDSYHAPHCAASSVASDDGIENLRAIANDLCDELEESLAAEAAPCPVTCRKACCRAELA